VSLSRSQQMARIQSAHTLPEIALRSALWRLGLRFRLHAKGVSGKPDVVFPRARVLLFVDGCFWHGCPDHYVPPRSRGRYWADKLAGNVSRDRRRVRELADAGWRVVRVRECQVEENLPVVIERVIDALTNPAWTAPPCWRVLRVHQTADEKEVRHLVDLCGASHREERRARSFIRQGRRAKATSDGP
jgi:DNA mismatch endonuclease (patch repair protein)